jgi:hypothetical protein
MSPPLYRELLPHGVQRCRCALSARRVAISAVLALAAPADLVTVSYRAVRSARAADAEPWQAVHGVTRRRSASRSCSRAIAERDELLAVLRQLAGDVTVKVAQERGRLAHGLPLAIERDVVPH